MSFKVRKHVKEKNSWQYRMEGLDYIALLLFWLGKKINYYYDFMYFIISVSQLQACGGSCTKLQRLHLSGPLNCTLRLKFKVLFLLRHLPTGLSHVSYNIPVLDQHKLFFMLKKKKVILIDRYRLTIPTFQTTPTINHVLKYSIV